MEASSENPKFTASDVRKVGGISYRQLNDWDSKGALPNQREQSSGWRRFDPKRFFVILVCVEMRKQFGVSIEKLAWLQRFMLQDGADHFSAAVRMMKHGLAVFILTDLSQQFDMEADCAISDLLGAGYCRNDEPQSYILLSVNPLVNKMLAVLKNPTRLSISDKPYDALRNADYAMRVHDTAELAVLELMRRRNVSKFSVIQKNDEVKLEIEREAEKGADLQKELEDENFQTVVVKRQDGKNVRISRKVLRKVAKEEIGIVAVRLDE